MKELLLDLKWIDKEGGETWADSPAKAYLESIMLDFAGYVVRVKITKAKGSPKSRGWRD